MYEGSRGKSLPRHSRGQSAIQYSPEYLPAGDEIRLAGHARRPLFLAASRRCAGSAQAGLTRVHADVHVPIFRSADSGVTREPKREKDRQREEGEGEAIAQVVRGDEDKKGCSRSDLAPRASGQRSLPQELS